MILEKQTDATILSEGNSQDSIGMSLDLDSAQMLMQMLSKNLYSDGIGSTIRETASNALDSHRRAGIDKPIVVSFKQNNQGNYEFSVEDFGAGLDDDDVKNIISKYGKSTKRTQANELGMFGLGFKSPLAYSSSFYFVCRKNGVERKYMMYEGEEINTIDLLYETPTEECNGVKVIVPVNYRDRHDFVTKIKEQLAYFENVYFNVDGISNDFTIFRGEHFQFSELCTDRKLHICLDNVYYPVDFSKLGIESIWFPVALRFGLSDGIFPIPNREAIKMTKEAKEAILNKITLVADYFVSKYNQNIEDGDDIRAVFNYFDSNYRYVKGFKEGNSLDIKDLKMFSNISLKAPKLKNINLLDLRDLYHNRTHLTSEYEKKYQLSRGVFRECKRYWDMNFNYSDFLNKKCFFFSDRISGVKKDYLKATFKGAELFFIKKVGSYQLGKMNRANDYSKYYIDLLTLRKHPKSEWRARIKEFQYIMSLITANVVDLDAFEIPQDWLDNRKKEKDALKIKIPSLGRKTRLEGEIVGKRAEKLERFVNGKNSKLVPITYKLENLHKQKGMIVYGNNQDAEKIDKLYSVFPKKVSFVVFSDRELKLLENVNIHNLIPLNKFMEGKNKPFKRIVTAYLINSFISENRSIFSKKQRLEDVSIDLYSKVRMLEDYKDKHFQRGSDEIYKAMFEVAIQNNLFDTEVFVIYKEVKAVFAKLPFLKPLFIEMSGYSNQEGMHLVLCDLFKYYKQKIDWKNYKLVLNEEPTDLTETIVEDLVEN
jgi:hypothetical protein